MAIFISILITVLLISSSTTAANSWKKHEIPCTKIDQELTADDFLAVTNKTEVVFSYCASYLLTFKLSQSMIDGLSIKGDRDITTLKCANTSEGLEFTNVRNLHLENLHILECGSIGSDTHVASLNLTNCTNITIKNVIIENGKGTGLAMVNSGNTVIIENSIFRNNGHSEHKQQWHIMINSTHNDFHKRGGGMQILVGGGTENSSITIYNCEFVNNSAENGGGMFVAVQQEAKDNTVKILQTNFVQNECQREGGGIQMAYVAHNTTAEGVTENKIIIRNCNFTRNKAGHGGGTALFSTLGMMPVFAKNYVNFTDCIWSGNSAKIGMAMTVAIASWETLSRLGYFPSPVFTNCRFCRHKQSTVDIWQSSVFSATGFQLVFQKKTAFFENDATAIDATSCVLDFEANSFNEFTDNHGLKGGALYLRGLTILYTHKNSTFVFKRNHAHSNGGAIYIESYDKHSIYSSDSCFFQNKDGGEPKNVTITFENNTAGNKMLNSEFRGDSIFATSIAPCLVKCHHLFSIDYKPTIETLQCIGQVSFTPRKRLISTEADHFLHTNVENVEDDLMCRYFLNVTDETVRLNENYGKGKMSSIDEIKAIPGQTVKVPYKLIDEMCAEIFFQAMVHVLHSDQDSIEINSADSIITENRIILNGNPGDSGEIQMSTIGINAKIQKVKVVMDDCPPGYIHNKSSKTCICSADNMTSGYIEVRRCSAETFQASITQGFWIGYLPKDMFNGTKEQRLAILVCPKGFCKYKDKYCHLPNTSDTELLSLAICQDNREGIACGNCIRNHSIYYRSMLYTCGPDKSCHLGWIYYILAELAPLTIIFLIVIFLNISFTSGPLNSVIFFVQTLETFRLQAENGISMHPTITELQKFPMFVYRAFGLNPFALESLSFCLWKGASALDMLAFKYVTITYSLLLVIVTILVLKSCNFRVTRKNRNIKHSIIHGLSAFLVMSYTDCTRVTFSILTSGRMTIGPQSNASYKTIAFYSGSFDYMGKDHIVYAVPAIFFLMTMVIIPPLLLLSYPLCYKVLAFFKIEESKCVQITCKIIPLEKMKPLFDSMQGAFKDRYRFFAGLYFFYRFSALLIFSTIDTLTSYYTATICQLLIILFLHAICHPYKKTWHNALDLAIILNLAIINVLTMYNYQLSTTLSSDQAESTITVLQSLRLILILLPLVYLAVFTGYTIAKRQKINCRYKLKSIKEDDSVNDILEELDRSRRSINSEVEADRYQLLKEM